MNCHLRTAASGTVLTSVQSSSQSPTSITLSWDQPAGDAVDTYYIVYTYQGGCSDYTQPENMATVNDGTAREYTLHNLLEKSRYNIMISVFYCGGMRMVMSTTATTLRSGTTHYRVIHVSMVKTIFSLVIQLPVVLLCL